MKNEILITGGNLTEIERIMQWIKKDDAWKTVTANTVEEAIEKIHLYQIDLVLLMDSINNDEERKLRAVFQRQHPDVKIIRYRNEEEDDLLTVITAIPERNAAIKPAVKIIDNAFGPNK